MKQIYEFFGMILSLDYKNTMMINNLFVYVTLFGFSLTIPSINAAESKCKVSSATYIHNNQQGDFKAIETDEIIQSVKEIVEHDYPGAGIAEAFIDISGSYKLILAIDRKTKIVYIDQNGNWFTPEQRG